MPNDTKNVNHANGADTLVFLALGGTGMRTVEPLLHFCALGLGPNRLKLVLVDPDLKNAAIDRATKLILAYNTVRTRINGGTPPKNGYFRTEVTTAVDRGTVWSPVADDAALPNQRFGTRVDRQLMNQGGGRVGRVFDFLFSSAHRDMNLDLGFRGVPSIGTVFMNRIRQQPFFRQILSQATGNAGTVCFAVGSVFGGTGAAALPVVGQALVDGIEAKGDDPEIPGLGASRVGAALILPFFTLPTTTDGESGIRPRTELFAQNAAAALPTYVSGETKYGRMYVIGDEDQSEQAVNAIGGGAQDNKAHYVELYAALAALDFARTAVANPTEKTFQYISVGDDDEPEERNVRWRDLPIDDNSIVRLKGGIAALHLFLKVFRPNGGPEPHLARTLRGATWIEELGMPANLKAQSAGFDALADYFMRMWEWFHDLRTSSPSLAMAKSNGVAPADVSVAETLAGWNAERQFRDPFELFRYWNRAAAKRRGEGSGAFLEVMQEGSEAYVRAQFAVPERNAHLELETA